MNYKNATVFIALTLLSSAAHAGSAPKELYGKSIIIAWGEHQSTRKLGEANFRDSNIPLTRKIYISTKDQWFSRFASLGRGYEGGRERVGTSGPSQTGGARQIQFSGRTITIAGANPGGLFRRTTIEFNENFTTCEAHLVFAKQVGFDVVRGVDLYTGQPQEVGSATVISGPSCSVRDGNVFAQ